MTDKLASLGSLSADDRAVYDQIVRKENDRYMAALRELYRELTGEPATASTPARGDSSFYTSCSD
jgi:hypothetical protein